MKRASRVVLVGVLAFGLAACQPPEEQAEMAGPAPEPATANTLTPAEEADGWQLLFDGQSTAGWRAYGAEGVPARWSATDGALAFDPTVEGGGDIITAETYDDFELAFEWKISECGNSGVMYRVVESDEYGATYFTGPEYQIIDNTCHPDAENGLDRTAAANYALNPPLTDVTNPAGEWNQSRIVVDGPRVEHWLNGEMVVEYELWTEPWKEAVAASKFNAWPDYGMARAGHIAFQDHGDPVWYRNIKIRPLSPTAEG